MNVLSQRNFYATEARGVNNNNAIVKITAK